MTTQELLTYLNDCKNLELTIYSLSKEKSTLDGKLTSLGIAKEIDDIRRRDYIYSAEAISKIWDFFGFSYQAETLGWILSPFIFILGLIIDVISYSFRYLVANGKYRRAVERHDLAVQEDKERVEREDKQKPIYQARITELEKQINAYSSLLSKLYDIDIVYPKYRSMIPIVMFCEYLESRRCDQLGGHEGAYNIYENELRQNIIIGKLDVIISRLDQIKANQWMLYDAMERVNKNVSRLCEATYQCADEMKNIRQNSVIIAQNSKLSTQYTRTLADIEKYKMYIDDSITTTTPNKFLY